MSDVKPVAWMHDVVDSDGDDPDLALSFYEDSFPFCDVGFRSVKANPLYSQATITALQAEIESLRKDVERLRFCVAHSSYPINCPQGYLMRLSGRFVFGNSPLEAIDAAIAKEKQP